MNVSSVLPTVIMRARNNSSPLTKGKAPPTLASDQEATPQTSSITLKLQQGLILAPQGPKFLNSISGYVRKRLNLREVRLQGLPHERQDSKATVSLCWTNVTQ